VGKTLDLHANKLAQSYDEIEKLTLVIHQHTFELNEIHLSLESLEERLKELISQRGNSHKD